jgi:predicted transcriptional regulator
MKDTTEKEIPQSQSSHEHTEQIRELQEKMDKILQLLAEITQNKLSKELQQNQSETK